MRVKNQMHRKKKKTRTLGKNGSAGEGVELGKKS